MSMLFPATAAVYAWGAKPEPPPPPPSLLETALVPGILVAIVVVLLTALVLMLRKGGGSSAGAAPAAATNKAVPKEEESYPRGPLVILWGSQTGTAESFSSLLMREAKQHGFKARSVDIEDYEPDELKEEAAPVIFLMATHGEGEPTDNAVAFYEYMNNKGARTAGELSDVRFAVFALGNKQYEHFCYMGRWAHAALEGLGATPLHELGEGDDDEDLEGDFEKWREGLWEALGAGADDMPLTAPQPSFEAVWREPSSPTGGGAANGGAAHGGSAADSLPWLRKAFPKFTLAECAVGTNRELCKQPSQGSTRHIELAVAKPGKPAYLRYHTADDLAVCCDNGTALAERVAAALRLDPASKFSLKPLPSAAGAPPPLPTPCTVDQALRFFADVRAPVSKPLLLLLAAHNGEPAQADALRRLASAEGKAEYSAYIQRDGRGLLDVLTEYPASRPPWGALLELVPKLTPRYYTISSSPAKDPTTVHLTVKVLREPMRAAEARTKIGVCSTQLESLTPGSNAVVFVRESAFRLPRDGATPVIMVGPGTGVAPFRAFLQEMEAAAAAGKTRSGASWLYFGCRRRDVDYLYESELEAAQTAGVLSSLRLAFSRAQASKVYVQDKLREDGAALWRLLGEQKGHVYICGGTSMGRDVVAALQAIVVTHGGRSEAEAAAFIKDMTTAGRLVQELWS